MYELIKFAELKFPKKINISEDAKDFITKVRRNCLLKLLDRNSETRLGSNRGIQDLKSHPFFKDINFDLILNRKVHFIYLFNRFLLLIFLS